MRTPTAGAIGSNLSRTFASFTDGLSNTPPRLGSEDLHPAYHDCGTVPAGAPIGPAAYPDVPTVLASVYAAPTAGCKAVTAPAGLPGGGPHPLEQRQLVLRRLHHGPAAEHQVASGDGRPRRRHEFGGRGRRRPDLRRVTSRSYHPGGVNALFGDGSVKFIKNSINWQTWRALGTVAGGEVVSADSY